MDGSTKRAWSGQAQLIVDKDSHTISYGLRGAPAATRYFGTDEEPA